MPNTKNINPDPRIGIPDEDMLQLALSRYRVAEGRVDRLRDKWDTAYKLYRSYVEQPDWPFDTALHIPLTFSTVESFLPRMVAQKPRIVVEARNDEDTATASAHRQVLDWQWDFIGMNVKIAEFVTTQIVTGKREGDM